MALAKTGERINEENITTSAEYVMYLRHLFAYEYARGCLYANDRVLDLGCGEGYGTHFLSSHVRTITGLDVDEKVVEHAKQKYGQGGNCTYSVYDGLKIPFEAGQFDAVISFQVVEHAPDEQAFVKEAARVLKPGGKFILTTPNKATRLLPYEKPFNEFHIREYYPHELRELLKQAFADVSVFGVMADDRIVQMENERIKRIHENLANRVKKWVPSGIRSAVRRTLEQLKSPEFTAGNQQDGGGFKISDYFLIKEDVYRALDLLAVCSG
jgi:2-polyprenyl-3-methyl-5-hydroxy-6-metoxy-1,4-benzoquinol methylase